MEQISLKKQYLILSVLGLYFFVVGLLSQDITSIFNGLYDIIIQPDLLITDYISIGGIGATFVNASIISFITLYILYRLSVPVQGNTIVAFFLMLGFSMFGKNILNIWLILFGVFLYSVYHGDHLRDHIFVGLYGTSLSPIITQMLLLVPLPPVTKLIISSFVGIMIGFVLPPLSKHLYATHGGYSLYNVGFSAGVLSTIIVSVFKSFGVESQAVLVWSTGNNTYFIYVLCIYFIMMIAYGLYRERFNLNKYRTLLKETGVGNPDFVSKYDFSTVLINMGVNGLLATWIVVLVGGDLNGPTIGGICTIVGFSATGKHMFNIVPILLGVMLAGYFKVWDIHDPACMITLLFSTTLAPIAGKYGFIPGIIAGFIHSSVALNIIVLYDGMNLYNNGFAGGFVACFMVPILDSFIERNRNVSHNSCC